MDVFEAVEKRFSVRAFAQDPVSQETLAKLVDAARKSPTGANRQALEYVAVNDPAVCGEIFQQLKWAALTAPKGTPGEGETPTAYIMVVRRKDYEMPKVSPYDIGAAVQTICLGAVALGLATCWMKSVNYPKLTKILELPENVELDSVVAIGAPGEFPQRDEIAADKDGIEVIKYYRDDDNQQHVPKRALETILHQQKYGG